MIVRLLAVCVLAVTALLLTGCGAAALPIIPTAPPTATPTPTPPRPSAATQTAIASLPTPTPTIDPAFVLPTGGPSPTPLFGPTRPAPDAPTPIGGGFALGSGAANAPRIEFFTTDTAAVAPGSDVTLYWSTRGASSAVIYRLQNGSRNQLWNVGPDGALTVQTRRADRGAVEFELTVGDGAQETALRLSIPLACPDAWFFQPAPADCPSAPAEEITLIEQPFERGRMLAVQAADPADTLIYALFNDGFPPAWTAFENRYNPAVDPEFDPNFPNPPGLYQPVRALGFVWRGRDAVRNRLGLGAQPEAVYTGFVQSASTSAGVTVYASSADGTVIQLLPEGALWQIIEISAE